MSADAPQPSDSPPAPTWEPLSPLDRRIVGVLIEKQKTSKSTDAYPLTLNALVTGCNQKSNRDPIVELDEVEVEEGWRRYRARDGDPHRGRAGGPLPARGVRQVDAVRAGARGARRALAPRAANKGDLRVRAARMAPIDTLDQLDEVLKPLVDKGLVVYLTGPDRRGAVVTHGFHTADELARAKAQHAGAPVSIADAAAPAPRPAAVTAAPAPGLRRGSRPKSKL
jgi:uncharacterized protein YceH (UPF0502 family)